MGVGEVDAGPRLTLTSTWPSAGSGWGWSSTSWSASGPPNSVITTARMAGTLPSSTAMSLTVVGSIAFDAVETETGKRDRLLGGSAVHFSLASSFFADTRVVGPVGDDFGEDEYAALHSRGVITDDIEHVEGGKTFFWAGRYERDVNIRHTLQTDLNVFEHFQPSLSEASAAADVVFLANIQPDLQREVREQCTRGALRGDGLDEPVDRHRARVAAAHDQHRRRRDPQRRRDQAAHRRAEPRARRAQDARPRARRVVVAKQGEYGSALFTRDSYFALPAYPTPDVIDPTGRRRLVRRRLRGLHRRAPGRGRSTTACCAAPWPTAPRCASFNVEAFGPERVLSLTGDEIAGRVADLHRSSSFDDAPIALR